QAKASCFRTDETAAPGRSLAGQYTGEIVPDPLVLAKQVADFTFTDTDIPGRHIRFGTDMAVKFGHETLAETHDFIIRLVPGIKISTTFAGAQRKPGKAVFECLFKR